LNIASAAGKARLEGWGEAAGVEFVIRYHSKEMAPFFM
jgi:hypothetical protein